MKPRKQKLRDAEANGGGINPTPAETNGRKPTCIKNKGNNITIGSNEAYALINVTKSSKVSVCPNKAYAVSNLNRTKDGAEGFVTNKAYGVHNVSRCVNVPVSPNEAYAVCEGGGRDEPVYELVK